MDSSPSPDLRACDENIEEEQKVLKSDLERFDLATKVDQDEHQKSSILSEQSEMTTMVAGGGCR